MHILQAQQTQSAARAATAERRVQQLIAEFEQLQGSHHQAEEKKAALEVELLSFGHSLQSTQVICCCVWVLLLGTADWYVLCLTVASLYVVYQQPSGCRH